MEDLWSAVQEAWYDKSKNLFLIDNIRDIQMCAIYLYIAVFIYVCVFDNGSEVLWNDVILIFKQKNF